VANGDGSPAIGGEGREPVRLVQVALTLALQESKR
jgi:hypothetical protein